MSDFSWKSINHKIFGGKKAESIRFTGSGGHGLVTASVILAKAGVYEGHNVLQSQVYGAEARGGSTKSETVIREGDIYFPKLVNPDVLLALTSEGLEKYRVDVKKDGLIIFDSVLIPDEKSTGDGPFAIGIPMWSELIKELKTGTAINVMSLGLIVGFTEIVGRESLERAVHENFRPEFKTNNQKALDIGYKIAQEVKNG
ncbi:MAG TPA: 2-oxoacid:acceptor oxidoreductase family protein [Caldisericia bacterium]|nr:2-oxoacid:acceptor oxidoreductase family protein [Caldisericia bacterium]HOR47561.1 2-oxoacid:acceptor oxidoreductase family protein [Caldisericia bacterium]HOU07877.1 2-oxoacid:acceptor oxidoreductase family protein [Caldisericia bacterium]HPL90011.1 2-oxoacid:acceptor oxidoreductase family protein [Caldisericia bacterium]HQG59646.1 2-oxoacid:acceptor oxidoreductase family protein [Caldisericia bacterium]